MSEQKPPEGMTQEQTDLYNELTRLQRRVCLNILDGMKDIEAYKAAEGKAKTEDSAYSCVSQILSNLKVSRFMRSMEEQALKNSLCNTVDIVRGLMKEAGIGLDENGKPNYAPPDTKQAGRVSALKTLSDFTGGFDANKQQIEHSGHIQTNLDELYGED